MNQGNSSDNLFKLEADLDYLKAETAALAAESSKKVSQIASKFEPTGTPVNPPLFTQKAGYLIEKKPVSFPEPPPPLKPSFEPADWNVLNEDILPIEDKDIGIIPSPNPSRVTSRSSLAGSVTSTRIEEITPIEIPSMAPAASSSVPASSAPIAEQSTAVKVVVENASYPQISVVDDAEKEITDDYAGGPAVGMQALIDDPLLQPLLPKSEVREDLLDRFARLLGWGEQLATFNVLDNVHLHSLDVFRGIALAGMLFMNSVGVLFPAINYSPWDGLNVADLFEPFFLFGIGVSSALAFKRVPSKRIALSRVASRIFKLIIIGLIIEGGYFHGSSSLEFGISITDMRYCGFLQRVALGFGFVSLCEIAVMKKYRDRPSSGLWGLISTFLLHWGITILFIIAYLALTYLLYVPDYSFTPPYPLAIDSSTNTSSLIDANTTSLLNVTCGVRGDLTPACNVARYIDQKAFGIHHLFKHPSYTNSDECSVNSPLPGPLPDDFASWCLAPFEPYGILSTMSAVLTVFAGLHFGHILTHYRGMWARVMNSLLFGVLFLIIGYCLQFPLEAELQETFPSLPDWMIINYPGMPFNKSLYSLSFMFFTSGVATVVLLLLHLLVDAAGVRFYTKIFEWIGLNSLLVFVFGICGVLQALVSGLYWNYGTENLITLLSNFYQTIIATEEYAMLASAISLVLFWSLLSGFLHNHNIKWAF